MWDKVILLMFLLLIANGLGSKKKKTMAIKEMRDLLISAGFPSETIDLFVAQAGNETGNLNFNSELSQTHYNYSGIKYLYPVYQDKYGVRGTKAPDGGYYVKYNTPQDWAKDYHRIMAYRGTANAIGAPINASDTTDFVNRLHANAYFQANPTDYKKGVDVFYNKLKNIA